MYGRDWENQRLLLVPASAFPRRKIFYLHFLRRAATVRMKAREYVYGGLAAGHLGLHQRLWQQYSEEQREKGPSKHNTVWSMEGVTDDAFFTVATYEFDAPLGIYDIAEGFAIAALGLFEGPRFLATISRLQLPVVSDRCYRDIGLGLNMVDGLVEFGGMTEEHRADNTAIKLRDRAYDLVMREVSVRINQNSEPAISIMDSVYRPTVQWPAENADALKQEEAILFLAISKDGKEHPKVFFNLPTNDLAAKPAFNTFGLMLNFPDMKKSVAEGLYATEE